MTTTYAWKDDIIQPKFLGCIDKQILIHMVLCSTLEDHHHWLVQLDGYETVEHQAWVNSQPDLYFKGL